MARAASRPRQQIIALGGGGFGSQPDNPALDRYLIAATGRRTPRVLFLPTASGDAETYQLKFFKTYARLGARPDVLELFAFDRRADIAAKLLGQDLIFVGGGNTPAMIDVWRRYGIDRLLARALRQGTVLAGVSAGANCWFERYLTDSVPGGGVCEGLGLVPGLFCPHFDSESWRRPMWQRLHRREPQLTGYAADDAAALHLVDGRPWRALCSVDGRQVWQLGATIEPLPTRLLRPRP